MNQKVNKAMAFYNKQNMIYEGYVWSTYADDNPKITGKPDSTLLSRHEGYEVLYFINALAKDMGLIYKAGGEKIEMLLHEHVPTSIRSQENIKEWIKINWKNY